MRLKIDAHPAAGILCAAIGIRAFCGLMVDSPQPNNGAWISLLIGAALAAPLVACLRRIASRPPEGAAGSAGALLSLLLLGTNLIDGAAMLNRIVRSAGYLALSRFSEASLILPTVLAVLWCATRNGNALGYSAALWMRAFLILVALIAVLQFKHYRPAWLRPLLGSGWKVILDDAVKVAGWMASISALALIAQVKSVSPTVPFLGGLFGAAIGAVVLCLLRMMMTPTFAPERGASWVMRLDSLLSNGRSALYLQLPLTIAWFAGMLRLITCECFAAAALLQRLAPRLGGKVCILVAIALVVGLTLFPSFEVLYSRYVAPLQFLPLAGMTALAFAMSVRQGKGARACAG